MEARAEIPSLSRYGVSGYLNYALGRVHFYNPVSGGFVTEAEHLEPGRFLAPMDQTHTLTGGLSYRHARFGLFAATAVEYGSGTPTTHAEGETIGDESDPAHTHAASAADAARVPSSSPQTSRPASICCAARTAVRGCRCRSTSRTSPTIST
jgi:hypothetical protein